MAQLFSASLVYILRATPWREGGGGGGRGEGVAAIENQTERLDSSSAREMQRERKKILKIAKSYGCASIVNKAGICIGSVEHVNRFFESPAAEGDA